jgi:hypothetical protein
MVRARRAVARPHFTAADLPAPPVLGHHATPAVAGLLKRTRATCLVRSLVLQRWHAAHGDRRDLIIGVTSPQAGFTAHAWLEGEPVGWVGDFVELTRQRAPG